MAVSFASQEPTTNAANVRANDPLTDEIRTIHQISASENNSLLAASECDPDSVPVHNVLISVTRNPSHLRTMNQTAPNNHHWTCPRAANSHDDATEPSSQLPETNNHEESTRTIQENKSRWWMFSRTDTAGTPRSRTREIGYRVLCSFINDFMPWIIGSYVIFQAFKYGMLELGLAAFLVMLSVHGILKWCNAASAIRDDNIDDLESECDTRRNSSETDTSRDYLYLHHHHRHLNDTDFSSNDESDVTDHSSVNDKVIIVMDEPPPSYDVASKPTAKDLELDLQVHLTPILSPEQCGLNGYSASGIGRLDTRGSRRPHVLPCSSCVSSEVDDDSLPSYTEATKRIKRKKKRKNSANNRSLMTENNDDTEEQTLIHPMEKKHVASNDRQVSIPIVHSSLSDVDITEVPVAHNDGTDVCADVVNGARVDRVRDVHTGIRDTRESHTHNCTRSDATCIVRLDARDMISIFPHDANLTFNSLEIV
ncbi:uncharacterized protein LOC108666123 [Hyalella azteca]|uniref:Uncharacterized protein LOC108666123 n=1 Tax=Hyalella azteca TaxID=294128 RepID=A0A8B7N529_HYAAZ|nr:uncharacterized protein LOC108666123 [Hyalella azteca]